MYTLRYTQVGMYTLWYTRGYDRCTSWYVLPGYGRGVPPGMYYPGIWERCTSLGICLSYTPWVYPTILTADLATRYRATRVLVAGR